MSPSNATQPITGELFDQMVLRGAFDHFTPGKIELIRGEIRFMNPAGPIHDDLITYLEEWSHSSRTPDQFAIRVQCGIAVDDHRPEPDVAWLSPGRYGRRRPAAADVRLLIEVADSSLVDNLSTKADLYAVGGIGEYWIVDVANERILVMRDSDGATYRDIQVIPRGQTLNSKCHPSAVLHTDDLFNIDAAL